MPPRSGRSENQRNTVTQSLPLKKSVACRSCHARKIRCSGSKPCNNCIRASECIYPARDRQIRVHQSFLDRILQENAELRAREAQPSQPTPANTPWQRNSVPNEGQDAAGNQILEECDWFAHTGTSDTPIWIGEISDSAFATRFRQFASSSQAPCHIPRTQFASDDAICGLAGTTPAWPSPSRARLLAETARQFLQRNYHIVRQSEVLPRLRTNSFDEESSGARHTTRAKMWALFAIGELRSSRCPSSANNISGLAYFAAASNAIRMVNERPQLDVIETVLLLLLLALYSLETNRRHSACTFVGFALRLATIMGLHVNISHAFVPNPELREHRVRVWWSVYILDRFLSSKIGLPLLISDDDISVDLPSSDPVLNSEDFGDHLHLVAIVRLAKIAGHISRSLYVRTPQRDTFFQRVENIRDELKIWREQLADHLKPQFDSEEKHTQPATSTLQLSFNQLLILATRPVLLFVFRRHIDDRGATSDTALPEHARDVADSCVRSARQSCQLLLHSWVNGEFHTFDYFYTQHLFSAAVILAIAGSLGWESSMDDNEEFNLAAGFLQQLEQNGNPAAMEFSSHIKGIQTTLASLRSAIRPPNTLPTSEELGLQPSPELFQPTNSNMLPAVTGSVEDEHNPQTSDALPLDLSFLDGWIYGNALDQLCWQEL